MAIIAYEKEISPGVKKVFYEVRIETRNRYTKLRAQKRKKGIPSRAKAELIYRELWSECRERRPDGAQFKNWRALWESYINHLYSKRRSPSNPTGFNPRVVESRRSRLRPTEKWGDMHLDLVTPIFVLNHLDEMEKAGSTRCATNHTLKEVKCMFSYAVLMGAIKANPFTGVKLRKEPKRRKEALTHEEVDLLLREAKSRGHKYYYIWLLTISLGLRRSELAGLKWTDIDLDRQLIYLRRQKIPGEGIVEFLKDREERVIAIPAFLSASLKELKLRSTSDFVIDIECAQWRLGSQSKVIGEFCKLIGIKKVTHHQLRATHITLALIDGIPLGIVKENVGHAKLSTTDLYFRSAGINMVGQMDGLKISVPSDSPVTVLKLPNAT